MVKKGEQYEVLVKENEQQSEYVHDGIVTVTCVRMCGHSSGGTEYYIYFDNGTKVMTSDWCWNLQWQDNGKQYIAKKVK